MSQLALPLQLADHAVFASFLDSGNETLVATLRGVATGSERYGCWLWGAASTGKTHLLQAVCDAAGDRAAGAPFLLGNFDRGGQAKELLDHKIIVRSNNYGHIEDAHLTLEHVICASLAVLKNQGTDKFQINN